MDAKPSPASVAIRTSGIDSTVTVVMLTARSARLSRHIAEATPRTSASGTQIAAATPASRSEFGSRLASSSATLRRATSD